MSWIHNMFGTEKPVIGLLHCKALPGDPFYDFCGMKKIIEYAKRDLEALQEGGVDGILVTNEFSMPYQKKVSGVTLSAMGTICGSLINELSIPFGAEAIYDGEATIELCAGTNAAFTRCLFTGAWVGDLGIIDRDISATLRRKHDLRLDNLKMFYFISSEDEKGINDRSDEEIVQSMSFNCRPDAFVANGSGPGNSPSISYLADLIKVTRNTPLVCGTGVNTNNAEEIFRICSGAFVGSAFKQDGDFGKGLDKKMIMSFMDMIKKIR
jgi:uncharacterized protein